jgi:Holliday junction resolvase RusA-like endonuclease
VSSSPRDLFSGVEDQVTAPIVIVAYGLPAAKGSKKAIGTGITNDGREFTRMVEMSKKVVPWQRAVQKAAQAVYKAQPLDCPLGARLVFTMPKPQSAPKSRRTWPAVTPDLDKLCRSTLDALKKAGVVKDDARFVEFDRAAKVYPGEDPESLLAPGVRIEIRVVA